MSEKKIQVTPQQLFDYDSPEGLAIRRVIESAAGMPLQAMFHLTLDPEKGRTRNQQLSESIACTAYWLLVAAHELSDAEESNEYNKTVWNDVIDRAKRRQQDHEAKLKFRERQRINAPFQEPELVK